MERIQQWDKPLSPETARWFNSTSSASPIAALLPNGLDFFGGVFPHRKEYAAASINRIQLVTQLTASHQSRNAPQRVLKSIQELTDENTFLVAAGQQPGLCGGPLLTAYKIIQTITLAKQLSAKHGQRFIPAFWNAAEDHDLSEISTLNWFSKENKIIPFHWEIPEQNQPYFSIPAGDFPVDAIAEFISANSHPTEFLTPLLDELRLAVDETKSYADVFDRIIWNWFGIEGLIILRPDDAYTRAAAIPIIKHEIENPAHSPLDINRMGEHLAQQGLPAQIHKRDDRTSFFLIQNNRRIPLYIREGVFVDDTGIIFSKDELLKMLESNPSAFSPSAVLRPVIQDAVYPTAAVALGPNEMAYHALLHPLYERHQIPRPCVVPRSGFTLLEPRMMKWMEQYGLSVDDLKEHPSTLLKRYVKESQTSEDELPVVALMQSLNRFFDTSIERAKAVDASIVSSLEKNKTKIVKEIENSENLVLRREAAKHETMQSHIEALQAFVYPSGQPQERCLNLLYFLSKYGKTVLNDLIELSSHVEHGSHAFVKIP